MMKFRLPYPVILLSALITLSFFFAIPRSEARWESLDEDGAVSTVEHRYQVNKDGTYSLSIDERITIKNDGARTTYGTIPLRYNSGRARVTSVAAETIWNGRASKVSADQIEDKPEKAKDVGFDKTHNLAIAFPNVNVGTTLHYKVEWLHHTVPLKNKFSEKLYFGYGRAQVPPTRTIIRSKIPLKVVVQDSEKYLSVDHHREGEYDVVDVKLLRPINRRPVSEKNGGWFKDSPFPQVAVASTEDWKDIGLAFSGDYEHELSQALPKEFKALAEKAVKTEKDFIARTNLFTSGLSEIVRYHGDWRTRKGSYIGRPLATIRDSQFGDCKDMALVTVASLRHMGYRAHVALINRGFDIPDPLLLPGTSSFNHAMVRAEDDKGIVHWIDPTNSSSRAQAIRADIAGRPALVLDGKNSRLETTTAMNPEDAVSVRSVTYDFFPQEEKVKAQIDLAYKGHFAERFTGLELSSSKKQIEEGFLLQAADGAEVLESKMEPFDLTSRITRDLRFKLEYTAAYKIEETTAGLAYNLAPVNEGLSKLDIRDRVSGYDLGTPDRFEGIRILKNAKVIGNAAKPCRFQSPWIDGERSIIDGDSEGDGSIKVREILVTKAYGISKEEFATPAFKALQSSLKECLGSYSIIFASRSASSLSQATH